MPTPVTRPSNYPLPFASSGAKNTIPTPATGTGKASFTEGFPAVTMLPLTAGGIPPEGKDFNGILYDVTSHTVWVNAGGQYQFDAALSTAIGGYPAGMVLQSNDGMSAYVSAVANNTTDFNTTPSSIGTSWMPWAGNALQNASIIWCGTSGGSANVQTFTPTPAVSAYVAGQTFSGIAGFTNTASLTVNISGLGAVTVKKPSPTGPINLTGGEWVAGNVITIKYDGSAFQLTDTDLGALAFMGIDQGLEDDGSRNLRVKLADGSIRRTASGIQTNDPISSTAVNLNLAASQHGSTILATAVVTVTAMQTSTVWNGYNVTIDANGGAVTFTPNAADSVNGMATGRPYTVLKGSSVNMVTDGAGNWWPIFQTAALGSMYPRYINAPDTIGAGMYNVDTSAGAFSLTLTSSPNNGDSIRLIDCTGTWVNRQLTLLPNGSKIAGSTSNFICNVAGADVMFRYVAASNDWRIQ